MKKITFLLAAISLFFFACNTTPKPKPEVFEPNLRSPNVKIGEADIQFDRTFPLPGIRKITANVYYFPIEDAVCIQWRMDLWTYNQFWSAQGREEFVKALERYKTDFENRSFGKGSRRTKRMYGTATGYLAWRMFRYTEQARDINIVDFGYYLVDRSPYFVVNQRSTNYKSPYGRDVNLNIPEMAMYFTRAQADELVALFSREFLSSVNLDNLTTGLEVEYDDY